MWIKFQLQLLYRVYCTGLEPDLLSNPNFYTTKSFRNSMAISFLANSSLKKWDLFLKEINGFMLNVTDHYCISPATSKGGFPVIRVICHESVIYVTGHVSHRSEAQGLLPRITRQSETFLMATVFRCRMLAIYQSLSLFLGLTYRASPLLWDKY